MRPDAAVIINHVASEPVITRTLRFLHLDAVVPNQLAGRCSTDPSDIDTHRGLRPHSVHNVTKGYPLYHQCAARIHNCTQALEIHKWSPYRGDDGCPSISSVL